MELIGFGNDLLRNHPMDESESKPIERNRTDEKWKRNII